MPAPSARRPLGVRLSPWGASTFRPAKTRQTWKPAPLVPKKESR